MAEDIINPQVEQIENEDELFVIVDNNLSDSEKIDAPRYSYWKSVIRSFFKNRVNIIALALLIVVLLLAYIQPLFSDFQRMNGIEGDKNVPPFTTWKHIFGTDKFGDDIWSLTWSGTQFSLTLAFVATAINMVLGIIVGALWGYSKFFDKIFTELYNIIANVPSLVVTLIIMYSLTGRIGFFSSSSIDGDKRIFYESADTTSDFIKLLVKLINNIGDSFNEELWGGSTLHVLDFWERFNSPST